MGGAVSGHRGQPVWAQLRALSTYGLAYGVATHAGGAPLSMACRASDRPHRKGLLSGVGAVSSTHLLWVEVFIISVINRKTGGIVMGVYPSLMKMFRFFASLFESDGD